MPEKFRLHIGGTEPKPGWKILNIQPGPGVDYLGTATDLSVFRDASVDEAYASHIYEHLGYNEDLLQALREAFRVLKPGGVLRVGVPNLEVLASFLLQKELHVEDHFEIVRMIYGGQTDVFDYHKCGFTFAVLEKFLKWAGFVNVKRVDQFALFNDTTTITFLGVPISLNVMCEKPTT